MSWSWVWCGVCDHGPAVTVIRHTALVTSAAANNGKLNALEAHQSLADIVVRRWVNQASLGIAEEFVQRVVSCALADLVRVVVQGLRLINSVVDGAVCGALWRSAVEAGGVTASMLLAIVSLAWILGIIITTCCSSESLQVSDKFSVVLLVATAAVAGAARLGRAQ